MKLIALPVAIALSLLCAASASAEEYCKNPSSGDSNLKFDQLADYLSTPSGKTIECTSVKYDGDRHLALYTCGQIDVIINTRQLSMGISISGDYKTYLYKETRCLMDTPTRTEQLEVYGSNDVEFSLKSIRTYKRSQIDIDKL